DTDGSIVIAGQWYSSSDARFSALARRLGPDGSVRWTIESDAIGDDSYDAVAIGHALGLLYVAGSDANGNAWLRALDRGGSVVWERSRAPGIARGVAVAANGDVIVVGTGPAAWLARYTAGGDPVAS